MIRVAFDANTELVEISFSAAMGLELRLYPDAAAELGGKLLELTREIEDRTPP